MEVVHFKIFSTFVKKTSMLQLFVLIFTVILFCTHTVVSNGQSKADSLPVKLKTLKQDTDKIKLLIKAGKSFQSTNPDSALHYLGLAFNISTKSNSNKLTAECLNSIGIVYGKQGLYSKAIECFMKSLKIYEGLSNLSGMATCYSNIGTVYANHNTNNKAIGYYLKAINIFEKLNDSAETAKCLNNIGTLYSYDSDNTKALEYYTKSLNISARLGDKGGMAICYNNMGSLYTGQGAASTDKDISAAKYNTAVMYYKKALKIYSEDSNKHGMSHVHINIADMNIKLKNYKAAIDNVTKALKIARGLGALQLQNTAYEISAIAYDSMHDYKNAYLNYKLFKQINDSVFNTEKSRLIEEMQLKYETQKKEKEIEIQARKISQQQLTLGKNKIWLIIILSGILFLIILSAAGFLYYKSKQKSKLKAEMLQQQELRTKAIIDTQEEERKRIAQDLHDDIGHKLTAIKLNFEKIKEDVNLNSGNIKLASQISAMIDETHKDVRAISHQVMPRALQEKELAPAIDDLIEQTLSNSGIKYFLSNKAPFYLPENIRVCVYRVLQELLNNIIKHAQASEISVQIFRNKNILVMMVEDNGTGINKSETGNTGIGLAGIAGRVTAAGGSFFIEKGPAKGTVATIRIPL